MDIKCIADFNFLSHPSVLGTLTIESKKGKTYCYFQYDKGWIVEHGDIFLDPDLLNISDHQYPEDRIMFAFLEDCSPDRWGRTLIRRKLQKEQKFSLTDFDYLLNVEDKTRLGGLRFSSSDEDSFFAEKNFPVPPIEDLRKLEAYSKDYEKKGIDSEWFRLLVKPGSSLGGTRPKANIIDENGALWVAKFPSLKDSRDIGAWERTVSLLAFECGINTPQTRCFMTSENHTFLSKRFDRNGEKRVHMASFMTMIGKKDGEDASFLDIAEALEKYSSSPFEDLREMYRRIVFYAVFNNTDNHLRNHALLLSADGWRLSPMYDTNISIENTISALSLNGDEYDLGNSKSVYELSDYFRVGSKDREDIWGKTQKALSLLPLYARKEGISESEIKEVCSFLERE